MNKSRVCRFVSITCSTFTALPQHAVEVSKGSRLGTCVVEACQPDPCTYVPGLSRVMLSGGRRVEVEERKELVLLRVAGRREKEVYVYPKKVWETVESTIVKPIEKQLELQQQGAVFAGPPGTGKSSLAKVLQLLLKVPVVDITPSRVLSKYLGESEKFLESALVQAEQMEPCILFADEGEWLVAHRFMSSEQEVARVYANMASILLSRLQKWHDYNKHVLLLVTTNVDTSYIDPAYLRAGRLGDPVMFPLPDRDTVLAYVSEVLSDLKTDPRDVEDAVNKALSLGLSMADVATAVSSYRRKLLSGEKTTLYDEVSRRRPKESQYYKRGYAEARSEYGKALLKRLRDRYKYIAESRDRLYIHIDFPEPVAIAIATAFSIHVLGLQTIIATDFRYLDTALTTAETYGAVLILPTQSMPKEIIHGIHLRAKRVVYAGKYKPFDWILTITVVADPKDVFGIADTVLSFYGVKYTGKDIETLAKVINLLDKLQYIAAVPSISVLTEVKVLH